MNKDNGAGDAIRQYSVEAQKLNGVISSIKSDDYNIALHLNNLKRLSAQAMDLSNELNRQFSFYQNQVTYQDNSRKMQIRRDKDQAQREKRKQKV